MLCPPIFLPNSIKVRTFEPKNVDLYHSGFEALNIIL